MVHYLSDKNCKHHYQLTQKAVGLGKLVNAGAPTSICKVPGNVALQAAEGYVVDLQPST